MSSSTSLAAEAGMVNAGAKNNTVMIVMPSFKKRKRFMVGKLFLKYTAAIIAYTGG